MAACRAAHEAKALEEVQACEMAGGKPHTIREEAGSGAMVAARSRLPSAVSVPVRDDSVSSNVGCGVGTAKLGVAEAVGVCVKLGEADEVAIGFAVALVEAAPVALAVLCMLELASAVAVRLAVAEAVIVA